MQAERRGRLFDRVLGVDTHQCASIEEPGAADLDGQFDQTECRTLATELGDERGNTGHGIDVRFDRLPRVAGLVVGVLEELDRVDVGVDQCGAFDQRVRGGVEFLADGPDDLVGGAGWSELRKLKQSATASNVSLLGAGTTDARQLLLSLPVIVSNAIDDHAGLVIDRTAIVSAVGSVQVATSTDRISPPTRWVTASPGASVTRCLDRTGSARFTVAATGGP